MKSVLLIGLGRFGQHVAKELNERGHQVLAVDQTEERVNAVLAFVTSAQIGDSTSEEFLSSLGIRNFDTCIVAIGDSFQDSLETASLLKELGAKKVIARAASDVQEKFLLRNGADEVVYPEKQLASWMVTRCTSDYILDYIDLEGDSDIYELAIPESWKGKTVLQMDLRKKFGINILGTKQGKIWNMHVGPDTVFGEGESILVLGTQKSVERCFRM
ncbi:MAG: TrkA family potassium uptake protein [Firmicutes bacterium]|nr:TrkA family potassium uptake protein [Bacillota bacterium]